MLNRISRKLWPIEYWQNKKKQFMAGGLNERRIWMASGLAAVAVVFVATAVAGILTSKSYEQAQYIPLRPLPEVQLPAQIDPIDPSKTATKPIVPSKATDRPVASVQPEVPPHPSIWPGSGSLTLEFGWQQHPVMKDWIYHSGVDIATEVGQPVKATIGGKVTELRQDPRTGLTIVVATGSWTIHHGSLASATVKSGDTVNAGQTIGTSGESFHEPYPHIHLAIEKNGQFVNPVDVLPNLNKSH